jgi:hypothetical protein
MSPIWAVPVVVLTIGGAGIVALLRGTSESARDLVAEIARFGEMHAALARLRAETQEAGNSIARLRSH